MQNGSANRTPKSKLSTGCYHTSFAYLSQETFKAGDGFHATNIPTLYLGRAMEFPWFMNCFAKPLLRWNEKTLPTGAMPELQLKGRIL